MHKRNIQYTDFDGIQQTGEFYFNLTKMELVEMELATKEGGLAEFFKKLANSEDHEAMVREFKSIILKAYGVRSEDGQRFIKNDQVREEFRSHAAFDQLFFDLTQNESIMMEFLYGTFPADMIKAVQTAQPQDKPRGLPKPGPRPPKAQR